MQTTGVTMARATGVVATRNTAPARRPAPARGVNEHAIRNAPAGEHIAAHIERTGSWCLEQVVTAEWVARALAEAREQIASDEFEVIIDCVEASTATLADGVINDPAIRALLASVVAAAAPQVDISADRVNAQLRIVSGEDPLDRPLGFHYDRSVVTMVVPLIIPAGAPGKSGELVLVPNRRPLRRSALVNVVEKAYVQAAAFRKRFARKALASAEIVTVPLTPGNGYLFWGYRSYHTTLPCPPDSLRVTLVMHFGEVHDDSGLLKATKTAARYWRLRGDATTTVR